jgi:hypothetical protein
LTKQSQYGNSRKQRETPTNPLRPILTPTDLAMSFAISPLIRIVTTNDLATVTLIVTLLNLDRR